MALKCEALWERYVKFGLRERKPGRPLSLFDPHERDLYVLCGAVSCVAYRVGPPVFDCMQVLLSVGADNTRPSEHPFAGFRITGWGTDELLSNVLKRIYGDGYGQYLEHHNRWGRVWPVADLYYRIKEVQQGLFKRHPSEWLLFIEEALERERPEAHIPLLPR